ncbi:hypothetical protein D3C84_548510 [compost metagenome]
MFDEDQQQIKLTGRQRDHHVIRRAQFPAGDVEVPVGEVDQRPWTLLRQRSTVLHAAQHGTHSGQQFAGVEGFGQVIVGAEFEADHPITEFTHGGEHDHRDRVADAQLLAQDQPAVAGQHHVENDQVWRLALDGRPQRRAVGGDLDTVAVLDEEFFQQIEDFKVVVDN